MSFKVDKNKHIKLTKFGMIGLSVYFFLSIFEHYINFIIGNKVSFFMLFIAIYLLYRCLHVMKTNLYVNQIMLLIWFLYYLFTILWSTNIPQAKVYIFAMITMIIIMFSIYGLKFDGKQIDKLLFIFQISSFFLAILGMFFSVSFNSNNTMRYVLSLWGITTDPNYLLALYAISVEISLYNIIFKNKLKIFNGIIAGIGIYAILYTGSRSGVVILAISFFIIFLYKRSSLPVLNKLLWPIGAIMIALALMLTLRSYIPEDTWNRLFGIGDAIAFSDSTGRIDIWTEALSQWKGAALLFGMGFGSNTTHNTFITFLTEGGLIGSIPFLILLGMLIVSIFKKRNVLALLLFVPGMIQGFLCPASNMRFFWNAMIVPTLLLNAGDYYSLKREVKQPGKDFSKTEDVRSAYSGP